MLQRTRAQRRSRKPISRNFSDWASASAGALSNRAARKLGLSAYVFGDGGLDAQETLNGRTLPLPWLRYFTLAPMVNWCVSIYPTHAELPFVSRSTLDILRPHLQDAIDEAKQAIDRALEDLPAKVA